MFVAPAHMRAYAGQQPSAFAETDSIAFRRKSLTTLPRGAMSDPRNVAHAKKVTQEKKHQSQPARRRRASPPPSPCTTRLRQSPWLYRTRAQR